MLLKGREEEKEGVEAAVFFFSHNDTQTGASDTNNKVCMFTYKFPLFVLPRHVFSYWILVSCQSLVSFSLSVGH